MQKADIVLSILRKKPKMMNITNMTEFTEIFLTKIFTSKHIQKYMPKRAI